MDEYSKNLKKSFRLFTAMWSELLIVFLGATISSLVIIYSVSSLKILDPQNGYWLRYGDGNSEISWEFFRLTPFPDWLTGQIELFGLEAADSLFYSTLPPIYAFALRPFSIFLPERFQFFGLMIFLNLMLIYSISYLIFKRFKLNTFFSHFGSLIVVSSPISLYRFTELTHYVLTANWLILWAFYLIISRSTKKILWITLLILSTLIFPYYLPMILIIYIFWIINLLREKKISFINPIVVLIISSVISFIGLIQSGFKFNNELIDNTGFGLFKANLASMLISDGWSRIFSFFEFQRGEYEGFAYIGFIGITLLLISLIHLILSYTFKSKIKIGSHHLSLFAAAVVLFIISLSNKIDLLSTTLLELTYPQFYVDFMGNFRSTGRFIWPLAYFILIYPYVYFIKMITYFQSFTKSIFLIFLYLIYLFDASDIWSSQEQRYSKPLENRLTNAFWDSVGSCYRGINSVPAQKYTSHNYDLANIAYQNKIGIHPGFAARSSEKELNQLVQTTRNKIKMGDFQNDRLYVFQSSEYVIQSTINLDKEIALKTIDDAARAGIIDELLVIAPNFSNCSDLVRTHGSAFNIKKNRDYIVKSNELEFNSSSSSNSHLVEGWSQVEPWGVWSTSSRSSIILEKESDLRWSSITLFGKFFQRLDGSVPGIKIKINDLPANYTVTSSSTTQELIIKLQEPVNSSRIILIDIYFSNLVSPKSEGSSDDPRELGFGITKLQIN